jgi:preprotein translocase subunit Sec61beta
MADDRISMPSGMGGLVRYFDEYKSSIRIKPSYIVLLVALVIVFEFALRFIK